MRCHLAVHQSQAGNATPTAYCRISFGEPQDGGTDEAHPQGSQPTPKKKKPPGTQTARLCCASQRGKENARCASEQATSHNTTTGCQLRQAVPCLSPTPVSQSESDQSTPHHMQAHLRPGFQISENPLQERGDSPLRIGVACRCARSRYARRGKVGVGFANEGVGMCLFGAPKMEGGTISACGDKGWECDM